MPLEPGKLNFQQSPLYDTYELAASTATPTKIVFFANPTSATKSTALTNLQKGYELINGENFRVAAMRFLGVGMDEVDYQEFSKKYAATLIVSGKPLLEAPIDFFAGGGGISGAVTTTATTTTIKYANNGVPDPRAIAAIDREVQIMINQGETFRVELNGTTFNSTAAIFLRVYLDGIYGRAVG